MKSHKIQRIELILDKIKAGDSKREVMCIHFGHPMKKNGLGWCSPWKGGHGRSWNSMAGHGELVGEGKEGEETGRGCGLLAVGRREAHGGSTWGGGARSCCWCCLLVLFPWGFYSSYVSRKERGEREKEEKKGKKEKRMKKWKIFQT
jgi:hypothetical protein